MISILIFITAYFLGAIPFALIVGKIGYKVDLREKGSGNLGTTNTFRILGKKAGILVLIGDVLKGSIPVILANSLHIGIHPLLVGIMAVLGHCYSIYIGFKGGKAVATTAGVLLGYSPFLCISALLVFLIVLLITRYVSVSSALAIMFAFIYTLFFQFSDKVLLFFTFAVMIFIIYKHRTNFKRIKEGTEPKVFTKKS